MSDASNIQIEIKGLVALETIVYAQCQMAAMVAENEMRKHLGEAPAYVESNFLTLAEEMRGRFLNVI